MQAIWKTKAPAFALAAVLVILAGVSSCRRAAEQKQELDRERIQKAVVEWFADFYAGNDFNPVLQFVAYEQREDCVAVRLILSFPDLNELKRELTCELQNTEKGWIIIRAPDL